MANHHNDGLVVMSAIKRVSGRPALDDIENNVYPPVAVLTYWLNDDWNADSIGQSQPQCEFGITIIGSDVSLKQGAQMVEGAQRLTGAGCGRKKRDEVAFELKDRIQAYLKEACFVGVSRLSNIKAQGGAVEFDNGKMVNLIEITFNCKLKQGQHYLYANDEASEIDIDGENAAVIGIAPLGDVNNAD